MIATVSALQLSLFRPVQALAARGENAVGAANQILSAANGGAPVSPDDGSPASSPGHAMAFDSIFSVNHVDANELKVDLMQRVGKAFGLDMEDFDDSASFGRAVRAASEQLGEQDLQSISHELGLDDLHVSLDDVIDALEEPGGEGDRELLDALREKAGDDAASADPAASAVQFDDNGLYSPAG